MFKLFIFILLLISNLIANSIDISNLKNANILDKTYFINDKNNVYTYDDINSKLELKKLKESHIGAAQGPFWTKISLINNSNKIESITLYNLLSGINKIDVYILKDDKLIDIKYLGDFRDQKLQESLATYSNFNLVLTPKESITIISKIENYQIYNLGWNINTTSDFYKMNSKKIFYAGLLGGIFIIFVVFNVINYILYKKISYLIVCAVATSLCLYQYGFHGILYYLDIGLNLEFITALTWTSAYFFMSFLLLFAYFFFEQRKKYPKASYINIFFIISNFLIILLLLYALFFNEDFFKYISISTITVLGGTLYLSIFAIYALIKKEVGSIYYFLGEITILIVISFHTMGLFNIITYHDEIKFLLPFAYMANLIALVTALYFKNKKEQEDLKKSKLLLMEQSRFNSIGQAIGHVTHQWKTPLTSIGTSLTLLETIFHHENNKLNTVFEKQLPSMKKSIDIMKKSIDEFSTYYQTNMEKEDFILIQTIQNIVDILKSKLILNKINIIYEIDKDLKLYSYEHIISNTFLVLFNNSLEAFDTFNDENYIKISANIIDNKTIITYEDNAGGIKIKPIELVFDYFVTSKNNNKSSGIGLAVAKLLIEERLNGEISVKNNENGAVLTITI